MFPLTRQKDFSCLAWIFMVELTNRLWMEHIGEILAEQYFKEMQAEQRNYTCLALAGEKREEMESFAFIGAYGSDTTETDKLFGYTQVVFHNFYGKRLEPKFRATDSVKENGELLLTVRAVEGLPVETLLAEEKEIAAKAIADGFLQKEGDLLYPAIVVMQEETNREIQKLCEEFLDENKKLIEKMAEKQAKATKGLVPRHLSGDMAFTAIMIGVCQISSMVEAGIAGGILCEPKTGSEGTSLCLQLLPENLS
jgi:hypothetical protein